MRGRYNIEGHTAFISHQMKHYALAFLCTFFLFNGYSQLGGNSSYLLLDLPSSARVSALGGKYISVWDDDIDLAYLNPALLDSADAGQISLNYGNLFAGTRNGFASYGVDKPGIATFAATMQYLSYGEFSQRDEFNTDLGTFSASEYVLNLGAGREIDSLFRVGANLKFVHSQLESYQSSAIALDVAGTYRSKNKDFTIALVLRNAGVALTTYTEGQREKLPFAVDLGMTKRLSKSPLRFTLTLADLQKWDLSYTDPADIGRIDPLTGDEIPVEEKNVAEKILLHVHGGMEFLLGENFHLRLGYDFRRRSELSINDIPGGSGISWGLGLKISKFRLSYGRVIYNQSGASNHLGVAVRFSDFRKAS
jgi:hypothetical protein